MSEKARVIAAVLAALPLAQKAEHAIAQGVATFLHPDQASSSGGQNAPGSASSAAVHGPHGAAQPSTPLRLSSAVMSALLSLQETGGPS